MLTRRLFLAQTITAAVLSQTYLARSAAASDAIKIGFLIPRSGPGGLFGPSCEACATLAVETINASGGILGRTVEPLFADAGGTPADTVRGAQKLWRGDGALGFVGMHDSASREAVANTLKGRVPYIYTPVNEGGFCGPNLYNVGETPDQQLAPSIPWLAANKAATKWYLIGADYKWPRDTNEAAKRYIAAASGTVVGEEYYPITADNFDTSFARIRESGANAVLITLVGGGSVAFNRAFASFGLDKQAIRVGTLIEENTLAGIGAENSVGLYSTAGFFDALQTPAATEFKKAYSARFGASAPVLSTLGEGCYEGAMLLKALFEFAKSTEADKVAESAENVSYAGARGKAVLSGSFVSSDIYLAEAEGASFEIIQTFESVKPGTNCKAS